MMSCLAEGNMEPRYVWVKQSSKEIVGVSENLTVNADDDTEGDYAIMSCSNITSRNATLKVMRNPRVLTEPVRSAKTGSDVILQCKLESLSYCTKVTWTKDNEPADYEQCW